MEELIVNFTAGLFTLLMMLIVLWVCLSMAYGILCIACEQLGLSIPTFKKKIKTHAISEAEHLEYERFKKEHKAAQEELEQVINS